MQVHQQQPRGVLDRPELGSGSQIKVCLELLKALHFPSLSPLFHCRWRGHLERIKALRTLDLPRAPGWMGGPLWTPFSSRAQPHLINGGNLTRTLHTHSLKSQRLRGVQCENRDGNPHGHQFYWLTDQLLRVVKINFRLHTFRKHFVMNLGYPQKHLIRVNIWGLKQYNHIKTTINAKYLLLTWLLLSLWSICNN